MEVYGRDTILVQLRLASSSLCLISGDSGVGKSEVLRGLDSGWPDETIVPGARLLGSPIGSLQTAIVDQYAEALNLFVDLHSSLTAEIRDGLGRLLDRAATATARGVGNLLMAQLIGTLRGKFGDDVAELVKQVAPQLFSKNGNPFAERLSELGRPDTASALMALGEDIAGLMKARIIIRLDQAEVLNDDDLSLLGELSSRSVNAVQLFATFSTADPDSDRVLARLEARGAARFALLGLDRRGLEAWFLAESVPPDAWAAIERVSNGYPFFVRDAIALTRSGTSIEALPTPGGFESLLMLRWNGLDPKIQVLGLRLSPFRDIPDENFLETYLSLGPHEWATLRNALKMAGVFVERPDGTVWFHDRRRNYIWLSLMDARLRETTSRSVLENLKTWQADRAQIFPWVISSLIPLVEAAALEEEQDSVLKTLLQLEQAELSVLFAVLEIVEPSSDRGQFADTGEVIAYATSKFEEPLDPVQALESLQGKGLLMVVSDQRASLMCLTMSGVLTYATLLAVLEERVGRMPVPKFASTMFDYSLRGHLGVFTSASIILGEGTLRHHRFALLELQKQQAQHHGVYRLLPGLGVVAKVEGQHFTSTILFESLADREVSASRLSELQSTTRGPFDVLIESVIELPPTKIPSARYVELQQLIGSTEKVRVSNSSELCEVLRRKVSILEVLHRRMSPSESSALGLTNPKRLLVDFKTATGRLSWTEFVVSGLGTEVGVQLIDIASRVDASRDPLAELKLRRDGLLAANERIESWAIYSSGGFEIENPVVRNVKMLTERADEFNRSLDGIILAPDPDKLRAAIQIERDVQIAVLKDLRAGALADIEDRTLTFSIRLELWSQDDLSWGSGWLAQRIDIDDGLNRIEVNRLDAPPSDVNVWELTDAERLAMGLGSAPIIAISTGFASTIVGKLLGLGVSDFHIWERPRDEQEG